MGDAELMPRLKLVGRILVAVGALLVGYAFSLPDGSGTSARGLAGLLAGILMAVGSILTQYGDGDGRSESPTQPPAQ
jgi:hypothetical protein